MPDELDDALYQKIVAISRTADTKLERGECKDAARLYLEAFALLPQPVDQWEAATWLSGSCANALFLDRQYAAAYEELRRTLRFPNATSNPLIWLRHGQTLYELGQVPEAQRSLSNAYMLGGSDVFENEHPKYLDLIVELIDSSAS